MWYPIAQLSLPARPISPIWVDNLWRLLLVALMCVYFAPQLSAESPLISYRFSPDEHRFALVDNPVAAEGRSVQDVGLQLGALAVINGGFYTPEYRPTGYLKVDGEVINRYRNPKLSGLICIDQDGSMRVQFRGEIPDEAASVLQTGPFIVDPGRRLGLHTADYKQANRSVLVGHRNGDFSLVMAPSTSLMALAKHLLRDYPDLDWALNLDGGPVAGLWASDPQAGMHRNSVTSRNYLAVLPR